MIDIRRPIPNRRRQRAAGQAGFTLLELLIAISILGVGLLGIVKLQMQSGIGNMSSRNMTAAVNLTRSKFEEMRRIRMYCIPEAGGAEILHADLSNDGNDADLGNWTSPDHQEVAIFDEGGNPGGMFTMAWNVADNTPDVNMKTVRIRVTWQEGGRDKQVQLESQIARKNLEYYQ